ncbi:MAG: hypothetical protein MUO39_11075 [Steroidobacteraceae bacterium]|nr:hypothetical protein [Steroidobacteraceae bacterium]
MIEQIQDFVSEQTAAITSKVKQIREESTTTVRDAVVESAGSIKSLKSPVRVIARSGVKLTSVSQTAVASLIELQSDVLTSALSDVALRLERAARADGIVDLVRDQYELAYATRGRVVEDAQRAMQIFKVAGRDMKGVATHVYETIVDTAEEKAAPVAKAAKRAKRKTKRVVRKAKTKTRARKTAKAA